MPGINLAPIDLPSADDDNVIHTGYKFVYKAISQAFRQYQDVLENCEKRWENDVAARHELLSPLPIRALIDLSDQAMLCLRFSEAALAIHVNFARLLSYIEIMW
jgi:hypothetical protein